MNAREQWPRKVLLVIGVFGAAGGAVNFACILLGVWPRPPLLVVSESLLAAGFFGTRGIGRLATATGSFWALKSIVSWLGELGVPTYVRVVQIGEQAFYPSGITQLASLILTLAWAFKVPDYFARRRAAGFGLLGTPTFGWILVGAVTFWVANCVGMEISWMFPVEAGGLLVGRFPIAERLWSPLWLAAFSSIGLAFVGFLLPARSNQEPPVP